MLVKQSIEPGLVEAYMDLKYGICLELNNEVFGFDKNLMLAFVYVPPETPVCTQMMNVALLMIFVTCLYN